MAEYLRNGYADDVRWVRRTSRTQIVGFLLDNGCDMNAGADYDYGETSLNLALSNHDNEVAELLLDRGGNMLLRPNSNTYTPLAVAAQADNQDMIRRLLEKGVNVDATDSYGNGGTALQIAAFCCGTETVELLLEKGANINAVDCAGETPLYEAVGSGYDSLVEILVKAGAIVTRTYPDGKTLLDIIDKEEHPYPMIRQFLIDCGAK